MIAPVFALQGRRVYVAGHGGMVGQALCRRLAREDITLLTAPRRSLDLTDAKATDDWFQKHRPDVVFIAAARVGGIAANAAQPVEFLTENLRIAVNVISAAHAHDTPRLIFLGSSCIYPRLAPQPISEDALLSGPLEPTNEAYAIAKIAGHKLVEAMRREYGRAYLTLQPCNLYGPGDNFDLATGHVIAALMAKAHAAKVAHAKTLSVWGSGRPRREFLHVDDFADAAVFCAKHADGESILNVGTGRDMTIGEVADIIAQTVGFHGHLIYDPSRPDGTPQKRLDVSRLTALGWSARIPMRAGLAATYDWYCAHRLINHELEA